MRESWDPNEFGAFLSNLRNSSELSLEELARLVGSSRSTLSRLENDEIPRPFKGSMRKLVLALAETLCTSLKEAERYLALAGISPSLLTDTEEIRLGFISPIVQGSPAEATSLERLYSVCEQRLRELEVQASSSALPHLSLKIQECAKTRDEAQRRLKLLSFEQVPLLVGTRLAVDSHNGDQALETLEESADEYASQEALAAYLQRQRAVLLDMPAPGAAHLRVGDIIGDGGLFISPPWRFCSGAAPAKDVTEYLIEAIGEGQRVLLLGEAGQGKTTVLKRVYALMVDCLLLSFRDKRPIPLYIPLREISAFVGDPLEVLWSCVRETFPLSFERFASLVRASRVIFLFDGFDEIRGELTQPAINERASSKIFAYPCVLSCRKNFYESYLSISTIQEQYPHLVELQPLMLTNSMREYVYAFCGKKEETTAQKPVPPPEYILKTIEASHELRDLVQRPLLLEMMLDLFTDPEAAGEHEWNAAKLYQHYTEKWLKHEAAKPDSALKWHEKATLMQEIAWSIHAARVANASLSDRYQNGAITRHDLLLLLERLAPRYRHIPTRYIDLLHYDPEAASINIGYHLVYYGDQAPEDGYYDRGGQRCEGTLRSIFRRLKSDYYRSGWALDLLTLRTLLEQRGVTILNADKHYRPFLAAFLSSDYQEQQQNGVFVREARRLQEILEGAKQR